jgi:hypothetical protein
MSFEAFHSHEEIEEAIPVAWNDLTFEDVQSIVCDWTRRLAWAIEHEGEYIGVFSLGGCGASTPCIEHIPTAGHSSHMKEKPYCRYAPGRSVNAAQEPPRQ